MKAPLIAAAIAVLGFSVPAFADCSKAHPQALSASSTVVAQSSTPGDSAPKSEEGDQQQNDDDDN
ncbi:MAG TPA: hypothetical protein VGR91_15190 [Stellaceae bacterium]|nr:hypothetical protein [Stellaceae bacterium]